VPWTFTSRPTSAGRRICLRRGARGSQEVVLDHRDPILASDELEILAGHGRVAAAQLIGMEQAPIVRLSDLSPAERKAYVLADNKLALNAGWDREVLAIELQGLIDLGFDVDATGFALGEIEVILDEAVEGAPNDPSNGAEDEIPRVRDAAVSRSGDVWRAGRHRLVCGDARDKAAYESLLGNERADLIFTDPPYNVPLTATSAARAAFATGNSRWARERCPRHSSRRFSNRPSALRRSGAEMGQSLMRLKTVPAAAIWCLIRLAGLAQP
jgi:hypothetical protein